MRIYAISEKAEHGCVDKVPLETSMLRKMSSTVRVVSLATILGLLVTWLQ